MQVDDFTLRAGAFVAVIFMVIVVFLLGGCASPAPVNRPCGVIEDSLSDVQGKTQADNRRVFTHHARGKAAGCW